MFFRSYKEASEYARHEATRYKLDVYIRKSKEYGVNGCTVGFASRNDNVYATAEIVRPGEPCSADCSCFKEKR